MHSEGVTKPLGDHVFQAIRHAIITWTFAPGQELSEQILANHFGVGKAPVRNALGRLRQEGWVTSLPRQGHFVSGLTLRDVEDVFDLRELLEPEAMRRAAGRVDKGRLRDHLKRCAASYDLADAAEKESFLTAHRDFHVEIARAGNSPRITSAVEKLHNEFLRILFPTVTVKDRTQEWMNGHLKLVDTLSGGLGDVAAEMSKEGIRRSRDATLRAFARRGLMPDGAGSHVSVG